MVQRKVGEKVTTIIMIKSFLVNLSLTILKLLGSYFSHSKTLLGDAVHCLSDMSTDIIGLIGVKLSNKKPDDSHPFGHGKIEYLTSIIMSIFILSLSITIIFNTFNSEMANTNWIGIIIIIISILIKLILSSYLLKKGKEQNSNILITNGTESRYDALSSSLALIFMLISLLGSKIKILLYADIIGSLIMSIFTFKIGIEILFKNIKSILGEVEINNEKTKIIENYLKQNKKINRVRRVTLLKYGSYYVTTVDIIMDGSLTLKEIYKVEKQIKKDLKMSDMNIRYVTVNIKPKKEHTTL